MVTLILKVVEHFKIQPPPKGCSSRSLLCLWTTRWQTHTCLVCVVPVQVQVSDGSSLQAVQTESSYGTGSFVPPMSPASPSMSAWVQHSVPPNASMSYVAPGEFLVLSYLDFQLLAVILHIRALVVQYKSTLCDLRLLGQFWKRTLQMRMCTFLATDRNILTWL